MISGMLILFGHLMSPWWNWLRAFLRCQWNIYIDWWSKLIWNTQILLLLAWLKPLINAMMEGSMFCVQKYFIYLEQGPFLNIFPKPNYHLVITSPRPSCHAVWFWQLLRIFVPGASTWIKLLRFQKGEPFLVLRGGCPLCLREKSYRPLWFVVTDL